ncbi:MAG: 3-beta hydroxysteroid dehydrogenase [Robiginitomaculum sp.]|nr:MAG: 3-beta hydroxysteroid dehydrogenase [Robiginitomaculum sp.]
MSDRLLGKKALVTGAGSGLGAAMAAKFAEEGAKIALTDINYASAIAEADKINARYPGAAFALAHDVASQTSWEQALGEANERLGGLSVLVNNAGIGSVASVEDESLETFQKVFAVDVDSVFLGCKLAIPYMKPHAPGSIINISSIAGLYAAGNMAAYNSAKAAVWLLSKSVALHCASAGYDIRSNSLHPTFVRTPIMYEMGAALGAKNPQELERSLARNVPLGRIGEPDDVAWAAVYFASDESRFITGVELKIDGGMSAQ